MATALFMGTSGYSYGEWVDAGIYPQGTHAANMLPRYAENFMATELNYTWYQMPKAPSLTRMLDQVPEAFRFAVKLTRTMTHEVHKTAWVKEAMMFRQGIAPLVEGERLLSVLIQLPPYFQRTPDRRSYLAALLDELAGLPLAVEFRHPSWVNERVFSELARRRITLVTVDAPELPYLFPRLDTVTNPDLFYLRLHGRNSQGWRSGSMQKQFDYDYSEPELRELAAFMETTLMPEAETGVVFFNNHVRGQAPKNCLRLGAILGNNQTPQSEP
ncbi:MAG TPA: DUF72 domain-containing protein [Desulfobacteraceae bacterium]|nr:DUF72 domain-containing protein [Desulfobacteraceae bacterium]